MAASPKRRKPASTNKNGNVTVGSNKSRIVDYTQLGHTAAALTTIVGTLAFGNNAGFRSEEEKLMVSGAYAEYFKAKSIDDFPPGVALTIVLVAYAVPRLAEPTVKEKIGFGIKAMIAKWKNRRQKLQVAQ